MFRKIVSNLPFSPALIGQLGFYARRLRKEETTRRAGLIVTALALVIQSFAVFQPPESVNAASQADLIPGGISTKAQLLAHYDKNTKRIKGLFTSLGITRAELANTKKGSIKSGEVAGKYNWSAVKLYSPAQGEHRYVFNHGAGNVDFFYRPLKLTKEGSLPYPVLEGHSARQGWFAIKLDCGNLITNSPPKPAPKPAPETCPIPGKENLPANDPNCKLNPEATCSLVNASLSNRTLVSLSGKATVSNGATISKYTFVVKDANGTVVKTTSVSSTQTEVIAPSFEIDKPGKYSVSLIVTTSLGDKTNNTDCAKQFTIVPPKMCTYNPNLEATDPDCQPCEEGSNIWIKDPKCNTEIIMTKNAKNLTQGGIDAQKMKAKGGDKISYTISVENRGNKTANKVKVEEELLDVSEYANIIDKGGASFDTTSKTLSWGSMTIKPHEKESRTFIVQVIDPVPKTNSGTSNGASYDCNMTNTFGNSVDIAIECPIEKVIVEQTVSELPTTGPGENMAFASIILAVAVFFYARSRQLGKEVRLIRKSAHAGTL